MGLSFLLEILNEISIFKTQGFKPLKGLKMIINSNGQVFMSAESEPISALFLQVYFMCIAFFAVLYEKSEQNIIIQTGACIVHSGVI